MKERKSVSETKPATVKCVSDVLTACLEDERAELLAVLKRWNGRRITKRIIAELPGDVQDWYLLTGSKSSIYHQELTHRKSQVRYNLTRNPGDAFDLDEFLARCSWIGAASERNERRRAVMNDPGALAVIEDRAAYLAEMWESYRATYASFVDAVKSRGLESDLHDIRRALADDAMNPED